jgi:hypothetical protein
MHPIYKQLLLGIIVIISIVSTCNKCQKRSIYEASQKGWTPALEQQVYDVFYTRASSIATDEATKKQFADCCVSKVKELFPNGLANFNPNMSDSTKVAIMQIGADCAKTFESHVNIWEPAVIKQLKLQFYSYPETKLLTESAKAEYVDCIAFKVQAEFPNGLGDSKPQVFKDFIEKSRVECMKLIANKYQKLNKKQGIGKHVNIWKSADIIRLKLQIYGYPETKLLSQKLLKDEYVDCISFKVQEKFPNGLSDSLQLTQQDFIQKSRKGCMQFIVNKYQKTK